MNKKSHFNLNDDDLNFLKSHILLTSRVLFLTCKEALSSKFLSKSFIDYIHYVR